MKKLYIYAFAAILVTNASFASQQYARQQQPKTNIGATQSPEGWLKTNATLEQKKLIVNLQHNNALADFKVSTYKFVPYNSPEGQMINKLPSYVKDYLMNKFSSLLFEDAMHPLKDKQPNATIKVGGLQPHKATQKEIDNFISNKYDFIKW